MAVSLYDLSVGNYLQTLGGVEGFLSKGLAHFKEKNIDPNDVVEARLFEDMLPLRFQILATAHHSLGAMRGVQAGLFTPPAQLPPLDYAGLQKAVTEARGSAEARAGRRERPRRQDITFKVRDMTMPFTAENFLLSFSLPNFYHATTAYDILRLKGVPLGKRDFMGRMRLKK
jgi:hypothetical protein